jgi:type I restriction enzyme R subunit
MGEDALKQITRERFSAIRCSTTIDWNLKDDVRAAMRSKVRRLLAKYDDQPDRTEKAIELVMQQAELSAETQAAEGGR